MSNALLVVPHYACKPTTGGGQRTQLLFKALQSLDHINNIDVLVVDERGRSAEEFFPPSSKVTTVSICRRGEIGFWKLLRKILNSKIDKIAMAFGRRSVVYSSAMLKENINFDFSEYDYLIGRYLRPLAQVGIFESKSNSRIFLDIDDRDDVLYSSRLKTPGLSFFEKLILRSHLSQMKKIQNKLLPKCNHCWLASEADLQQLNTTSESYLPNIPFRELQNIIVPDISELSNEHIVLFVGAFGHRINRDGLDWFVKNSWPQISKEIPNSRLRVIGSGGWESVQSNYDAYHGVEIIGFCDSLQEEYERASLTVVPLFEGGGTKIKVLESYSFNRIACGTEHAYFGYEPLKTACSEAVAPNPQLLSETIIKLLKNPKLTNELASKGREIVNENFNHNVFFRSVEMGMKG